MRTCLTWAAVLMTALSMESHAADPAPAPPPAPTTVAPDLPAKEVASGAGAQPGCRDIASPTIVREPGCLRIVADISVSAPGESALTIFADDVTVDMGGHTLRGGGASSEAAGIHVLGGDNAVIRNGTISGFLYGVRIEPLLEDRVTGATIESTVVEEGTARGIVVQANRAFLRNNIVRNLTHYERWPGSQTIGVEVLAPLAEITGNLVSQIRSGNAVGISLPVGTRSGSVTDNVLVHAGKLEIADPPMPPEGAKLAADSLTVARNFVHAPRAGEPERPRCREVSSPSVIREPGCVRVIADIAVTEPGQSALAVYADRVSIDLGGYALSGPGASSAAAGIHVMGGDDISIRNGVIRGFLYAIRAEPLGADEIRSVTVERTVVDSGTARGIFADADRVVVKDNIVRNLSGFTGWEGSYTIGIEIAARSCEVGGNLLSEIYPIDTGESVGISLTESVRHCSLADNVLANSKRPALGRTIAFWIGRSVAPGNEEPSLVVARNLVSGFGYAYMATLEPGAIRDNTFGVDCTPDDVGTYGLDARANTFTRARSNCRDTLASLEKLAKGGNPDWRIRLAAAYIEQQWRRATDVDQAGECAYYWRAKEILEPFAAANNIAALQQMARLTPHMARCGDQR